MCVCVCGKGTLGEPLNEREVSVWWEYPVRVFGVVGEGAYSVCWGC